MNVAYPSDTMVTTGCCTVDYEMIYILDASTNPFQGFPVFPENLTIKTCSLTAFVKSADLYYSVV